MNIEITIGREDPHVLLLVHDPQPHVPRWILIAPGRAQKQFITDPSDHALEHNTATGAESEELLETATALLAGAIGQLEAGKRFEAALVAWSERTWSPGRCPEREDGPSRGITF
jgi:hypothetical protein